MSEKQEDKRLLFAEIMESLLRKAHENRNVLEYKDIDASFKDFDLTPERFDWILNHFEQQGIDVLNTNEDEDMIDDEAELINDEDILKGVSLEDPVRIYLKENPEIAEEIAARVIERAKAAPEKPVSAESLFGGEEEDEDELDLDGLN